MAKRQFEFELYRLNVVQGELLLFEDMNKPISDDQDIAAILKHSVQPRFTAEFSGQKNTFRWAVRDFTHYLDAGKGRGEVYGLTLAKSVVETAGEVVTDTGIEEGISELEPPIADTGHLFFYMRRHFVAVERRSAITNSRWRQALQDILKAAAQELEYSAWIELEPVPRHEEVIEAFRSFERLTRLRAVLRLPNPELSRYSKKLYDEMNNGSIREYMQDMKNPRGLNKKEGNLPHATMEMAAAGYKRGEVTLEGTRKGKQDVVRTGREAARGRISELRDYVRGMRDLVKTKEGQRVTEAVLDQIDRIAPVPGEEKKQ